MSALQAKIDKLEKENAMLGETRDRAETNEQERISLNNVIAANTNVITELLKTINSQNEGKCLPPVSVVFSHSIASFD